MAYRVRVWDLPTRIFHWLLVVCVVSLVVTGYMGAMEWHARFGYCVFALLLFRIVWGLVGGRWSRFSSFIYSPGSVLNYLKGRAHPDHLIGHSPLGAGSVFAILLVLAVQVGTGMVADDEISFTGPLNKFVETSKGLAATSYHKKIGQWLIIGLVALHIAAVLYYLIKKRMNLIRPMVAGDKEVAAPADSSRDDAVTRIVALVVLGVAAAVVTYIVRLAG